MGKFKIGDYVLVRWVDSYYYGSGKPRSRGIIRDIKKVKGKTIYEVEGDYGKGGFNGVTDAPASRLTKTTRYGE